MTLLSDHERSQSTVTLSDEQFAKLVELLTPGYELAKMYLAQNHPEAPPAAPEEKHADEPKGDAAT